MAYIEKEIKIPLENLDNFLAVLNSRGAKFLGKGFQRTIRMDRDDLSLEHEKKFLRVRSGSKNVVTLKAKIAKENKNIFERMEIETEIKEPDKMLAILSELGFTKQFIMEKYRAEWKYKKVDITVDEMPFGFYVELEGEEDDIYEMAKELGLDSNNKIIVTYWDIFADYNKENGLSGDNIIFTPSYKSVINSTLDEGKSC